MKSIPPLEPGKQGPCPGTIPQGNSFFGVPVLILFLSPLPVLSTGQVGSTIRRVPQVQSRSYVFLFNLRKHLYWNFSSSPPVSRIDRGLHTHLSKEPWCQTKSIWTPVPMYPLWDTFQPSIPHVESTRCPQGASTHAYGVLLEAWFQESNLASKSTQLPAMLFLSWYCIRLCQQNSVDTDLEWIKFCINMSPSKNTCFGTLNSMNETKDDIK